MALRCCCILLVRRPWDPRGSLAVLCLAKEAVGAPEVYRTSRQQHMCDKRKLWNQASTSPCDLPLCLGLAVSTQARKDPTSWSCQVTVATHWAHKRRGSLLQLTQVLENMPATLCHLGPPPKGCGQSPGG